MKMYKKDLVKMYQKECAHVYFGLRQIVQIIMNNLKMLN